MVGVLWFKKPKRFCVKKVWIQAVFGEESFICLRGTAQFRDKWVGHRETKTERTKEQEMKKDRRSHEWKVVKSKSPKSKSLNDVNGLKRGE